MANPHTDKKPKTRRGGGGGKKSPVFIIFVLTSSAGLNMSPSFSWLSFGLQVSRIYEEKSKTYMRRMYSETITLGRKSD